MIFVADDLKHAMNDDIDFGKRFAAPFFIVEMHGRASLNDVFINYPHLQKGPLPREAF